MIWAALQLLPPPHPTNKIFYIIFIISKSFAYQQGPTKKIHIRFALMVIRKQKNVNASVGCLFDVLKFIVFL